MAPLGGSPCIYCDNEHYIYYSSPIHVHVHVCMCFKTGSAQIFGCVFDGVMLGQFFEHYYESVCGCKVHVHVVGHLRRFGVSCLQLHVHVHTLHVKCLIMNPG